MKTVQTFTINTNQINAISSYLGTKPYQEVFGLIDMLVSITQPQTPELPETQEMPAEEMTDKKDKKDGGNNNRK